MHRRHQYVSTLFRAKHVDLLEEHDNSGSITLFDLLYSSTISAGTVNQTEPAQLLNKLKVAQGCPLDLSFSLVLHILLTNINSELRSRL
jgi:hypothetical protein